MRLLCIIFILIYPCFLLNGQQEIKGRIASSGYPLQHVHVANLASGLQTSSDKEGRYRILARPREELQFTYMGMDTVSIITEDVTTTLNLNMIPRIEVLDEVIVRKTRIEGQKDLELAYDTNPNIIRSSFGYLNKETAGYSLRIVGEDEIERASNLNTILMGRFAGVNAFCDLTTDELIVSMRSIQSLNNDGEVLFDVDGQVLTKVYCSQIWGNLKRIAFIPSYAGATLYGTSAKSGVVVINTKTGTNSARKYKDKPFDQALLRNNYLEKDPRKKPTNTKVLPAYLEALVQARTGEEAKTVFMDEKRKFGQNPYFLLDAYVHFSDIRKEMIFAEGILDGFLEVTSENPVMLKAMAYVLESGGRLEKAHELFKKVYVLRPDYAQSFIDMAASYRNLENHGSAASLYARYSYLLDAGLMTKDSVDLPELMERELNGLFTGKDAEVRNFKEAKGETGDYSTRLVFEWNDSEAEFELQFVNPDNQYFNWKHTLGEMPERIRSEKQFGYSMVDFLLDDALPGSWSVNATYLGNKQLTPTYLKATIYNNYGNKLQRREVKVFRLGTKGASQNLYSFDQTSRVVFDGQMD